MRRFKKIIALLFLCAGFVSAQDRGVGAGIIIGEPTGISAKIWTSRTNAVALGVGWSYGDWYWVRTANGYWQYVNGTYVHFHADYLWHSFNTIRSQQRFPLYYGVGLAINSGPTPSSYNWLGVRGTFGIEWLPHRAPLDVFLEVVPTLQIAPFSSFGFDAGIGTRFYF
ncbi:MAG: hypothetical protein KGJ59_11240 [Bacteroidota bacterium]|nr:hypothetical protein [Bacteroidota bacterium]